jgi:K+-sensing histidine kinase KdpD
LFGPDLPWQLPVYGCQNGAVSTSDAAGTVEAAGHFRIYLGAAAGAGKTYAMLNEGRRRRERGIDVAHTNVPGSGQNAKRWQDVLDLLAAGINVITTVNIQHLESIADEVEHMTGARVQERVPDWVVRKADQIELVDSSPEQLRRRMVHGNIYPEAKVSQALANFFRTNNLIALRELALRFLADETDEDLLDHLRQHEAKTVWETCERLMVAVTVAPGTDALLRRAARMAGRFKGELDVVLREAAPLGIDVHVIALHKPPRTPLAKSRPAAQAGAEAGAGAASGRDTAIQ